MFFSLCCFCLLASSCAQFILCQTLGSISTAMSWLFACRFRGRLLLARGVARGTYQISYNFEELRQFSLLANLSGQISLPIFLQTFNISIACAIQGCARQHHTKVFSCCSTAAWSVWLILVRCPANLNTSIVDFLNWWRKAQNINMYIKFLFSIAQLNREVSLQSMPNRLDYVPFSIFPFHSNRQIDIGFLQSLCTGTYIDIWTRHRTTTRTITNSVI